MLPNLVIIGAEKSGTSSLHYYLSLHSDIHMSKQKELNFFNENLSRKKGLAWYERQFSTRHRVNGETSPHYTRYPHEKGVVRYMHEVIPQAKLIYILRDPVERALSAYFDAWCGYGEDRSVEEAFQDLENNIYVDVSRYHFQLEQYLKYYPLDRILVLTAEELKDQREAVLKKVFRFLGVDENFFCREFARMLNRSKERYRRTRKEKPGWIKRRVLMAVQACLPGAVSRIIIRWVERAVPFERPSVPEDLQKKLTEILHDDVQKLRELTGIPFSTWSV